VKWRIPERIFKKFYTRNDPGVFIYEMAPADYLRLSPPLPDSEVQPFDESKIDGWPDLPCLCIDPDIGVNLAHAGRHRVAAMGKSGYDIIEIPIEMTPAPPRFDYSIEKMLAWQWNGYIPPLAEVCAEHEYKLKLHDNEKFALAEVFINSQVINTVSLCEKSGIDKNLADLAIPGMLAGIPSIQEAYDLMTQMLYKAFQCDEMMYQYRFSKARCRYDPETMTLVSCAQYIGNLLNVQSIKTAA